MSGTRLIDGILSLRQLPTWCNRAGRVDRCACDNLDAVRLWRRVTRWNSSGEGTVTVGRSDLPGARRFRGLRGHDRVQRSRYVRYRALHRLYLPDDWTQAVTCRRLVVSEKLTQHYLVCPLCDGRAKLLFMPRCVVDEFADAQLAMDYLQRDVLDAADRRLLIARYFWLLPPRRFVCRRCLGVRYGDVKNPALFGRGTLKHERHPHFDPREGSDWTVYTTRMCAKHYEALLPMIARMGAGRDKAEATLRRILAI